MSRFLAIGAAVALVFAAAGYAGFQWYRSGNEFAGAASRLMQHTMLDIHGKPVKLSEWGGQVLVVNFWATWCEPCKEEIPALVRTQKRFPSKTVQIVGIALDSAEKVSSFSASFAVNYPLLIGDLESIDLSKRVGNKSGGLPFTVIYAKDGTLFFSKLGLITEGELEREIRRAL